MLHDRDTIKKNIFQVIFDDQKKTESKRTCQAGQGVLNPLFLFVKMVAHEIKVINMGT